MKGYHLLEEYESTFIIQILKTVEFRNLNINKTLNFKTLRFVRSDIVYKCFRSLLASKKGENYSKNIIKSILNKVYPKDIPIDVKVIPHKKFVVPWL